MVIRQLLSIYATGLLTMAMVAGCAGKSGKVDYMDKARQALAHNQFQMAKSYVDSVRLQDPQNYDLIRESRQLLRKIEFAEQKRTHDYCDSLLKVRQAEFPVCQKDFTFQQNKEYGQAGYYVNIHQLTSRNRDRTYLQARIDEKGNLIVTSYYCGGVKIGHTRFRIYSSDGSFVETEDVPRDGSLNYAFSDEESNYEMVRFNKKKLNNVLDFIKNHADETLKVELSGKRKKSYTLARQDEQAILGAIDLSIVLSDINRLIEEMRLSQAKMNYLMSKMNEKESDSNV